MAYTVSEIFCALQGEGHRVGTRNVFVRFAGCNLKCNEAEHGFDCDTDFASIYKRFETAQALVSEVGEVWGGAEEGRAVILTGGEPTLQIDTELLQAFQNEKYFVAVETNGTKQMPYPEGVSWVSCSPKTAEHTLKLTDADELRYVRAERQGIPRPKVSADHLFLSPAADGDGPKRANLRHCMKLIEENPAWRLSVQMHKLWGIR